METLVAVGIACNVMQFLSFGHEVISLCKRVYRDKSPEPTLAQNGEHLEAVTKSLAEQLSQGPHPLTKPDQELLNIAQRCSGAAKDLVDEVTFLTLPTGRSQLRAVIEVAAKTRWRKRRLERLERDLAGCQKSMEATILIQVCSKTKALEIQQCEGFSRLANDLKTFIEQIAKGHTKLSDLVVAESARNREVIIQESGATRNIVAAESRLTRDVVTSEISQEIKKSEVGIKAHVASSTTALESSLSRELQSLSLETDSTRARERFLGSLRFPTMNERKNRVSSNDPKTFHWIFEDRGDQTDNITNDYDGSQQGYEDFEGDVNSDDLARYFKHDLDTRQASWDNFRAWLGSEEKIYWISGKPGSGKSTLMKFIISREETKTALEKWRPGCRLISHFLWSAGTDPLQRTVRGLLFSLIYQAADARANWVDDILRSRPILAHKANFCDWDDGELRALALEVFTTSERPFVIFMDGLDEVGKQDEAYDLVRLIDEWRSLPCIKMCVSSRPEHIFSSSLSGYQSLRIHELTYMDSVKYALSLLKDSFPALDSRYHWVMLVSRLVSKAQGVFLWLSLVAKSLRRGLDNGDNFDECLRRIDALPPDIMQLYQDMWARLGDDVELYRATAMMFFNLVMAAKTDKTNRSLADWRSLTVFQITAASDDSIQETFFGQGTPMTVSQIRKKCETTIKHFRTRCAGLLEISAIKGVGYTDIRRDNGAYDQLLPYLNMNVDFIHRTAYEFFETQEGQKLLTGDHSTTKFKDAVVRLFKASLIPPALWSFCLEKFKLFDARFFLHNLCSCSHILDDPAEAELSSLLSLCHRWYDQGFIQFNPSWNTPKSLIYTQPPFYFLVAYHGNLSSFAQAHVKPNTLGLYGCEYMDGLLFLACAGLYQPPTRQLSKIRHQFDFIRHLIQFGASFDHQRAYPIWSIPYKTDVPCQIPNCVEMEAPVDRLLVRLTTIFWPNSLVNFLNYNDIEEHRSLSSIIFSIIDSLLDAGANLSRSKTIYLFPSRLTRLRLEIEDRSSATFLAMSGNPGVEVEVTRAVLLDSILRHLHPEVHPSSRLKRIVASREIRIRAVTKFYPNGNRNHQSYSMRTEAEPEELLRITRSWLVGGYLSTAEGQTEFLKAQETEMQNFKQLCERFLEHAEEETWPTILSRQGLSFSEEDFGHGGYPLYRDPEDVEDAFRRLTSRAQSIIRAG